MMIKKIGILVVAIAFFVSCTDRLPGTVIRPELMKKLIWETTVADQVVQMDTSGLARQHRRDSATAAFSHVLAFYRISDKDFKQSLAYYEAHPDILKELLDSVNTYGSKLKDSLNKHYFPGAAKKASLAAPRSVSRLQKNISKPNSLPR